jgi:3-isopropylmalate/(R)-2-methylmalate dehydratase large subunit
VGLTLYEKIWREHVIRHFDDNEALLYVDLHLIREVSTPQAFSALRKTNRPVRRAPLTLAMADHNVPTLGQRSGTAAIADVESRVQLDALSEKVLRHAIDYLPMGSVGGGIVHVVAPEIGRTQPGMLIVCGDSHTSTHGAFGALAFGIGTTEVEHVLATQVIRARQSRTMWVTLTGETPAGVYAKDLALAFIAAVGSDAGTVAVIEYTGDTVRALSMEGRRTLCNMAIEAGARSGIVAPDGTTRDYLEGLPFAPKGAVWQAAEAYWTGLASDADATFDRHIELDARHLAPMVTWGTNPDQAMAVDALIPPANDAAARRALTYMSLDADAPILGTAIDVVFIGSCTNGRIEDLRVAAGIFGERAVARHVRALVVPGSQRAAEQAVREGLDKIFRESGCEWREPGCSMCIGLNGDKLQPGQRAASTSNRNFVGRQGPSGRTHLMSPAMAVAGAVKGCIADVREMF